ncbi:Uncharacterized protein TCM_035618 [Theobroma cacao]|uniref:Uncharacterized protein n=1 Tax=Theobroma cacao TaxID=3641 RepID=A0A061FJB2_THECC|nr:Uncharacterized protein TCM_035618 [Theobroma cacao]
MEANSTGDPLTRVDNVKENDPVRVGIKHGGLGMDNVPYDNSSNMFLASEELDDEDQEFDDLDSNDDFIKDVLMVFRVEFGFCGMQTLLKSKILDPFQRWQLYSMNGLLASNVKLFTKRRILAEGMVNYELMQVVVMILPRPLFMRSEIVGLIGINEMLDLISWGIIFVHIIRPRMGNGCPICFLNKLSSNLPSNAKCFVFIPRWMLLHQNRFTTANARSKAVGELLIVLMISINGMGWDPHRMISCQNQSLTLQGPQPGQTCAHLFASYLDLDPESFIKLKHSKKVRATSLATKL